MESILTASLILTLSFLATSTEASLKHSLFQNIAVNDVIFNDDLLWESTARSKLDCACQCSRHGNCLTFTFLKGSQTDNCRGHSSNMTSLSPAASASGARSSVLTEVSETTTTTQEPTTQPRTEEQTTACSATNIDGSWTVIQRRQNGAVDFQRGWNDYLNGFGDFCGDFWLGLENIHQLTSSGAYTLRVDLEDWEGNQRYAEYSSFSVGSAAFGYRLDACYGYSGNAGDSMSPHMGQEFSTRDHGPATGCATNGKDSGWWFGGCHTCNLNGYYYTSNPTPDDAGISWIDWRWYDYSYKFAQMKVTLT